MDHVRKTGAALEAHFQLLLWIIPTVEKFPRSQRLLVSDRIQSAALDIQDALIEATYTRDRDIHGAQVPVRHQGTVSGAPRA
jgi:hypothetical protein